MKINYFSILVIFCEETLKIKAYETSCPLKTASGVQNTPYWSSELGSLRKMARKTWNYQRVGKSSINIEKTIVLEGLL
jgi:hypothetical protein